MLNEDFWTQRYQNQQIGWDIGYISTPLQSYFQQLTRKDLRILIPGCGNAYEAEFLVKNDFQDITLVDISGFLVENLKKRFQAYPQVRIYHSDFFQHVGEYDLIVEQTFFCAITPDLRALYAQKMYELLAENGKLVGVLFDREFEQSPPFGGSRAEYINYFQPYFNFKVFETCYNSIPPRAGSELFMILQKKNHK
ncbi:MAG: TPMT family class I SAM-dependent methyltransferase [Raineya sp.]|nr:TPMT family class I SAM-dependent methyltransferase [Raineya sp.]